MKYPQKKLRADYKDIGNKTDALIKVGAITIGTQLGTAAIHKLAKHPVFLFTLGMITGVYINRNRKQIIASANYMVEQGKRLLMKSDGEDEFNNH